jgi:hypothetical protein
MSTSASLQVSDSPGHPNRRIPDAPPDGEMYDQGQRTIDISPNRIPTASTTLAGALHSQSRRSIPLFLMVTGNRVDVRPGERFGKTN